MKKSKFDYEKYEAHSIIKEKGYSAAVSPNTSVDFSEKSNFT